MAQFGALKTTLTSLSSHRGTPCCRLPLSASARAPNSAPRTTAVAILAAAQNGTCTLRSRFGNTLGVGQNSAAGEPEHPSGQRSITASFGLARGSDDVWSGS